MRITIGIDISKDTLYAYQLPDNQYIQAANDKTGHKTLARWIGNYDLPGGVRGNSRISPQS